MSERLISGFCPGAETARMDRVENHRVSLCSRLTGRVRGALTCRVPGPAPLSGRAPHLPQMGLREVPHAHALRNTGPAPGAVPGEPGGGRAGLCPG